MKKLILFFVIMLMGQPSVFASDTAQPGVGQQADSNCPTKDTETVVKEDVVISEDVSEDSSDQDAEAE